MFAINFDKFLLHLIQKMEKIRIIILEFIDKAHSKSRLNKIFTIEGTLYLSRLGLEQ